VHRIEHAGQERRGHDDEILERGQLIKLVRPDAGDDPKRA
jgi:hypothetical protein